MRGIAIAGESQIILVDTPGIFTPKRWLDCAMVETAWTEAREAEVAVLVADAARGFDDLVDPILQHAASARNRLRSPSTKSTKSIKKNCSRCRRGLKTASARWAVHDLGAIGRRGGRSETDLASRMLSGPWLFPEDQIADAPLRQWAAEVTREKMFMRLHEETPYSSTVETTDWKERKDG